MTLTHWFATQACVCYKHMSLTRCFAWFQQCCQKHCRPSSGQHVRQTSGRSSILQYPDVPDDHEQLVPDSNDASARCGDANTCGAVDSVLQNVPERTGASFCRAIVRCSNKHEHHMATKQSLKHLKFQNQTVTNHQNALTKINTRCDSLPGA